MSLLLQKLTGRKVAIVGNGNVKVDYSAEIDSADVVVRFNHFYNYDSGLVGKRVDIVLQTITPMYYNAKNRHDEIVRELKPHVFLVKNHFTYDSKLHDVYGSDVRVDFSTRFFDPYPIFTTGTTALKYLADHLTNAEVKCYGFQDDEDWKRYLQTDAKNFGVHPTERQVMLDSIKTLEALKITTPAKSIPRHIIVPVKRNSLGAPGKNRILLDKCLAEITQLDIPITVVGDDTELLNVAYIKYCDKGVTILALPAIGAYDDVTQTLNNWRIATGYEGDVAIVQCTSPRLKKEWVLEGFDNLQFAPVSATATPLSFKPTAVFAKAGGVYLPAYDRLPPASVARQLLPESVRVTGAVVTFHTDALDLPSFWSAGVMRPILVSDDDALDIDTTKDLEKVKEEL